MSEDYRIIQLRALGATIGEGVFFGPDVYTEPDFAPLLTIEDGVVIARGVSILLHDSALNNIAGEPVKFGRVILRHQCYIGANSTILCGVEIGAGSLIGACSVVTKSVPAGMVAYGHPARIVGDVAELIDKQRREQALNPLTYFLDLPIWRDRRDPAGSAAAVEHIQAFLHSLM